jgi:AraC family transcriptional activator of tynA and feaB
MRTIFSTTDVHPRDRFDYWHEVASRNLVGHESEPECQQSFQAELQVGAFAGLDLVMFGNSPMTVAVTARNAVHADTDQLFICRQLAGKLLLEQEGREAILEPGHITLLDPRLPYSGKFLAGSRMLVLKSRRRPLEARIGETRELTVRRFRQSGAANQLTSAFLAMLPAYSEGMDLPAEEIVADQVLDLVAVSLANTMQGEKARVSSARSLIIMKLRAAIEARLTDPTLDIKTVAAAAGVSVRYANAVLAEQNSSIMRLVMTRRLTHCRRALEDPSQAPRTVSEIAYGWGFSDMTHFGRKFRAAYGLLPTDYRRHARGISSG